MLELKAKYLDAKRKAMKLMEAGKLRAYIAQLAEVQELQLQIMNLTR